MARDYDEDRPRRRRYDDDRDDDRAPPPPKSNTGLILGILAGVFFVICAGGGFLAYRLVTAGKAAVAQAQQAIQAANARMQAEEETAEVREDLTEIAQALSDHEATLGRFPNDSYGPPAKKGGPPTVRPLLSWRVHLLPFLKQEGLYKKFKLDEPWDGPNNKPLIDQMPAVYGGPRAQAAGGFGKTFYRGFCHDGAMFEKPKQPGQNIWVTAATIPDGSSNTLMIVEAAEAIEWTRPDEWDWSPGKPRPRFGGTDPTREFFLGLTADRVIHRVRMDIPDETLRRLLNRQDGLAITPGWEHR
jgi:hypothetical protein